MNTWLTIAWRSALSRWTTLIWVVVAVALTVVSVLGIERLRETAKNNFSNAVTGVDLLVGPRSSATQLLLYSVFRVGEATANMSWPIAKSIDSHPAVAWTIPISLGDSHRGFPVIGTNEQYLKHLRFGDDQKIILSQGQWFSGVFEVVLGAQVAQKMNYKLGDKIVLTHGSGQVDPSAPSHADKPFSVVGILEMTGTPIDRSLHVSLTAIEAIHLGWESGMPGVSAMIPPEFVKKFNLEPKSVTALFVGLKSKVAVFEAQRYINNIPNEALMAVLPGVALDQLWQVLGAMEKAMLLMALLVGFVSLLALVAVLLTSLSQRFREFAVLRAVGAGPIQMFSLVLLESLLVVFAGCVLGLAALTTFEWLASPWILQTVGFALPVGRFGMTDLLWMAAIFSAAVVASFVPALLVAKRSLANGLQMRA